MQSEPVYGACENDIRRLALANDQLEDAGKARVSALPPLDEQRRIAEVLSAAESVVESLRNLKPLLHAAEIGLLENVMLGMPCSALVPVAKLLREPPRNGVSPSANSDGEGFKTVSISAVSDGLFDSTGCIKHAKIEADVARQFFVKRGDAFVIRGNGNRQFCGKVGLSNESHDELFYPDLLIRLRFDTNKILPQFAVAQWNLPSVHRRLSARAKSSNGSLLESQWTGHPCSQPLRPCSRGTEEK